MLLESNGMLFEVEPQAKAVREFQFVSVHVKIFFKGSELFTLASTKQ